MSAVKTVLATIAAVAVAYFAPQLIPAIGSWFGASGFLATVIGTVVVAAGLTAIQTILMTGKRTGSSIEAGKVNVRIAEPPRWMVAGSIRQGGGVVLGEFDAQGNLWFVLVHADSPLGAITKRYFDDEEIQVDAQGNVITNEFCLNSKKEPYTGSGTRVPYFRIWTTTHTLDNPVPPGVAELAAAIPGWTLADHVLAGTTYSVIRCAALRIEDRYKIYKWRGPLGLGEPSFSLVGEWGLPYDPRTKTNKFTRNAVLIWAWFRTQRYGRNKPVESVNWDRVAEQANICEQTVTGISGTQIRYACDTAVPENKERSIAEQEIMLACDAQLMVGEDGKWWPRVGYYETPLLKFYRNRDIIAMESVEAQNGESETQGVIVRYLDPDAKYTTQPSAAWLNPMYYVPGEAATFLTVDILTVQNHNQAMRLAKAIGMRSQPKYKLVPTTGLRGLRARQERLCTLQYDNTFAGDHEIVTPVELDEAGMFCGMGIVPVDADRWRLLSGEEKPKPVIADAAVGDENIALPTGIAYSKTGGQLAVIFDAPIRDDVTYEFQYIEATNTDLDGWIAMTVQMEQRGAYSGPVDTSRDYKVRYRTVTSSGRVTGWSDPPLTVPGTIQPIAAPTDLEAVGQPGQATLKWRNPADTRFGFVRVYRGSSNAFDASQAIADVPGGVSSVMTYTDARPAGTFYWWFQSYASGGTPFSDPAGPVSATIT